MILISGPSFLSEFLKNREKIIFPLSIITNIIIFFLLISCFETSYASSLKLVDEVGREVNFNFPPKRIISLAPNITEILYGLGLDEEIVGVTIHCNFPQKVKEKPKVGSYINIDFERVVSLKPELIIATAAGNTKDMVERLEKLGFPTYVIFPKKIQDIMKSVLNIGHIVNREREAHLIVQTMQNRLKKILELTRGLSRPKVFLQIGEAPLVTVGKGSFGDDLINLSGGENIAGNEKQMYPRLGIEEILKRAPEVIIVSTMNPQGDYQKVFLEWSRWKTIPAVKNKRIHLMDSDLIDRPSPRIIDGLKIMAKILHPAVFGR